MNVDPQNCELYVFLSSKAYFSTGFLISCHARGHHIKIQKLFGIFFPLGSNNAQALPILTLYWHCMPLTAFISTR